MFHQFWADSMEEERRIWGEFLGLLRGLDGFSLFHHGQYDATFLKKMEKRYGAVPKEFLAGKIINTLSPIYGRIYFPTYGNSLKEISARIGFKRDGAESSGLDAIAWRLEWERKRSCELKDTILKYNREDCEALAFLVTHLVEIGKSEKSESLIFCEDLKRRSPYRLGKNTFQFPEFEFVNRRAYFDYQHEKIYWRTNEDLKRKRKRQAGAAVKIPVDEVATADRPQACVHCASAAILKHQKSSRVIYDLKFADHGVRRWTTEHRSHRYICRSCRKTFYPRGHPETREKYGHGLVAWSVHQNIALRQSQENVASGLAEIFGFPLNRHASVAQFKERAARMYRPVYDEILSRVTSGNLVHVDETQVSVKGERNYVWVFTNLNEVAYVYARTREGSILSDLLKGFKGVMVSDYYPAYDAMACPQQRCLVHLIRDMNDDLFRHPFDLVYKEFVRNFGLLLKPIMQTIDRHGLLNRHLKAHKPAVEEFYRNHVYGVVDSELVLKYRTRFERNEGRLFTFLDHDGIPWNNNNAENAIKGFATLRRVMGGSSTEKGLRDSLALLSICQTLRNKGRSSLEFFRSKEMSLERFIASGRQGPDIG